MLALSANEITHVLTGRCRPKAAVQKEHPQVEHLDESLRPLFGTAVPEHILVQPDKQQAVLVQRSVLFFPIGRSALSFCWCRRPVTLPAAHADC